MFKEFSLEGKNVLITGGGRGIGKALALRGKRVTIATTCTHVSANIEHLTWRLLYQRLVEQGVVMMPFTAFRAVRSNAVIACNTITEKELSIESIRWCSPSAGGRTTVSSIC